MRDGAILLDLDGTLTDPFTGISRCIVHALESMSVPAPGKHELRRWIGPALKESFERYLDSLGEGDADLAVERYRERFSTTGLYENSVYPGIPEMLQQLRNLGMPIMVATAKPAVYAEEIVRHFGLEQWLDAVHGSELDGSLTDKSSLLAHIIEQQGLEPLECIMAGDRKHDMSAARHHGMNAVGVLWGYGSAVELLEAGADTLVASPAELAGLLIQSYPRH